MKASDFVRHGSEDHHQKTSSVDEYIAVSEAEAARILGMSRKTLRNWRCLGRGAPFVKYGSRNGAVRYVLADLLAWQQANKQNRC
jgi:hypothetical protein